MKKLNAAWIVFIVFTSLIVIGAIFYLFYRLYINHIYKRKRLWKEITRLSSKKSEENIQQHSTDLIPRQSIIPLIQEFLPNELNIQIQQRKMATRLQFDEPPVFGKDLTAEWNEMDTKSLFSLELMSNRTSYYTIDGEQSREELKFDEESLAKYFSMTSSNQLMTPPSSTEHLISIHNFQPPSHQFLYNSSIISLNNEINNSSNHTTVVDKINLSNSVSKK